MFKLPNYTFKQVIAMLIIGTMMMMESIDTNILNVAIPGIAANLQISPLNLKLAITSYLISLSIFIPISGYLADKFGTKIILLVAITGFGLSSLLCGVANSLVTLVIFRFLQGMAGALLVPVGRLLMLRVFPKPELVKAYMLISLPLLLGPLLAPAIGGVLVSYLNWRFIFFVNIPFALLALTATYKWVDNFKGEVNKFNWSAYLFLGLFLATLAYWLDTAIDIASAWEQAVIILISVSALIIYLRIELTSANNVVKFALFKVPSYRICFWGSALSRIALGARNFIIPLYLQLYLQLSPLVSGYLISWMALGYLGSRIAIAKLLKRWGYKQMLTIANYGSLLSMLAFCWVNNDSYLTIFIIVANGFFSAIILLLLNVLCFADISSNDYAAATSLNSTTQQLFFAVGVVWAAAILYLGNLTSQLNYSYTVFVLAFIAVAGIGFISQLWFRKIKQ